MATNPGMDEARLDAIRNQMTSNLADLNNRILTISPAITGVTATSDMFYIGDPNALPNAATNPFWVCVVGGGKQDGQDWESTPEFIGENIFHHKVHTNIYFYIHPDTFPEPTYTEFQQAELRERLRSRFCDWARLVCFNNLAALTIPLASNEYGSGNDHLDKAWVSEIFKGMVPKSFGGVVWLYSAHMLHSAEIV